TALSDRSRIILTYALCGFANLGSLAIMIGGISTLVPERRSEMARLAFRSLLAGTLAILTNAALVSLLSA
ncbi:MAG: nucleoside:proton symporter, partial [Clostridia bacterium]|nr:nucleoside:proton symporter [Clostridia bacterium]